MALGRGTCNGKTAVWTAGAACIWLNEQRVAGLPGVLAMEVNYTSHRARVRWDPQRIQLSQILRAIRSIGYRAFPANNATAEAARKREERALLWRLFVAGFGMMQVMMYALPAYLAEDGSMSDDITRLMRVASLVLTVPVVVWACGPFFRGAWRDRKLPTLARADGAQPTDGFAGADTDLWIWLASAALSVSAYFTYSWLLKMLGEKRFLVRLIETFIPIAVGSIMFFVVARLLGVKELDQAVQSLLGRFRRKKT